MREGKVDKGVDLNFKCFFLKKFTKWRRSEICASRCWCRLRSTEILVFTFHSFNCSFNSLSIPNCHVKCNECLTLLLLRITSKDDVETRDAPFSIPGALSLRAPNIQRFLPQDCCPQLPNCRYRFLQIK